MRHITFAILAYACILPFSSGAQTFGWAVSMGAAQQDRSNAVATDAVGNVYTTGLFRGTVDFDPGAGIFSMTSTTYGSDMFVQKLDPSGNLLWAVKLDGDSLSGGLSITTDAAGYVYVAGGFRGSKDFEPGSGTYSMSSAGGVDAFILKLTPDGVFAWARRIGGPGNEIIGVIRCDHAGNVVFTGTFEGTADFDPGAGVMNMTSAATSDPGTNVFVEKLGADGSFLWARHLSGSYTAMQPLGIAFDASNSVVFSGSFFGTVDFDPGTPVHAITVIGNNDMYVEKLDAAGNFLWVRRTGVSNWGGMSGIPLADAAGNFYICGGFGGGGGTGTADFDPGPAVYNLTAAFPGVDGFIWKLDNAGNFVWAKQMTAPGGWYSAEGAHMDANGN
ncbi:MAG TPA: hypothetical protein VFZ78_07230, partial [Flavisolibacter sp.]